MLLTYHALTKPRSYTPTTSNYHLWLAIYHGRILPMQGTHFPIYLTTLNTNSLFATNSRLFQLTLDTAGSNDKHCVQHATPQHGLSSSDVLSCTSSRGGCHPTFCHRIGKIAIVAFKSNLLFADLRPGTFQISDPVRLNLELYCPCISY
jgi:hypothetical protein